MTTFPVAGDYYKAVQVPGRAFTVPKLQTAEFVWDSLGPTLARGSSAVVFQAAVDGKPAGAALLHQERRLQPGPVQRAKLYLASHDLSPHVSGTIWLEEAIRVNHATWPVLQMGWIDGRTLNEYVDFLVAGSNVAALTTLAASWREHGRAAAEFQVRPRRPAARQRARRPGRPAPPGRLRRRLDSAAGRPVPAHRIRPPELPAPRAARVGPLARHLLRPCHLPLARRAQQGSRALAGALQLQEPAVLPDRLLRPVRNGGLEAARRAARPAGGRAGPAAEGMLRRRLGVGRRAWRRRSISRRPRPRRLPGGSSRPSP